MKQNIALGLVGLVLVVSGLAFAQGDAGTRTDENGEKIARLERDLLESQKRTEKLAADLAAELADTKAQLALVVRYLEQRAESSKALATTLDESEAAGFTFGLNPESRHILLRGWREHLADLQKDVPSTKPTPKPGDKVPAQGEAKPANAPR
jgi:hypothetical protein